MGLQYALFDNQLTPDPNDYAAKVQNLKINSIEDIVELMTQEGSILKSTEVNAVIIDFFKKLAQRLGKGEGFNSIFLGLTPSIRGVFTSEDDSFDPDRHDKVVNVVAGKVLKEALALMSVEKVAASAPIMPVIKKFIDVRSKSNTTLTPGRSAQLAGGYLKFNEAETDEGIFLINMADNSETKVDYVYENLPSSLRFEIPDALTTGTYTVEVRTRPKKAKTLRKGRYTDSLSVA